MTKRKRFFWIFFGIVILGYCLFQIVRNSYTKVLIGDSSRRTKAVIIDEKNYRGNQPVQPEFSYSYRFELDGKKYTGDSHDIDLKIGDLIEIEYNINFPNINRPLSLQE